MSSHYRTVTTLIVSLQSRVQCKEGSNHIPFTSLLFVANDNCSTKLDEDSSVKVDEDSSVKSGEDSSVKVEDSFVKAGEDSILKEGEDSSVKAVAPAAHMSAYRPSTRPAPRIKPPDVVAPTQSAPFWSSIIEPKCM